MLRMHRRAAAAAQPPARDARSRRRPPPSRRCSRRRAPRRNRPVRVEPVADAVEGRCWNAFVERHHYLGYTPLPGAQLRYLRPTASPSPCSASRRPRPGGLARQRNLPFVVNNARSSPDTHPQPRLAPRQVKNCGDATCSKPSANPALRRRRLEPNDPRRHGKLVPMADRFGWKTGRVTDPNASCRWRTALAAPSRVFWPRVHTGPCAHGLPQP